MKSLGSLHAGSGRRGGALANPYARPAFEFVFEDVGIDAPAGAYNDWTDTVSGTVVLAGGGGATAATWRNGKRAVSFTAGATGNDFDLDTTATELTWLFALQIPAGADFTGIGPSSTATALLKNFPLYFKGGTVIGSQPSASNRDSALDMTPYFGLDAIISVRQSASGIRFVMRIDGVSGRIVTTASGEACGTTEGISIGGWSGGGGELETPIALDGRILGALSDADQEEAVDWAAWEYDLITP